MSLSFDNDRQGRSTVSTATGTIDAVVANQAKGGKNACLQEHVIWPCVDNSDNAYPGSHRCFHFVGTQVPDGTEYPDDVAPIGSEYKRLIVTGTPGAVTGAEKYLKTSANTWQLYTMT